MLIALVLTSFLLPFIVEGQFLCPEGLQQSGCSCNNDTASINCTNTNLTGLPDDWPMDLKRLKINGSSGPWEVLHEIKYENLETLHLDSLGLHYIQQNAFSKLTKLEKLILKNNSIAGLTKSTFSGLENLQILDLNGNSLNYLSDGVFSEENLPKLRELQLERCQIFYMESKSIYKLENLNDLSLAWNKLSELPDLSSNKNLEFLSLEYNKEFSEVNNKFLECLPASLKSLILARNNIAFVFVNISIETKFDNYVIEEVDLSYNAIESFVTYGLERLKKLQSINLEGNLLTSVHQNSFPWQSKSLKRVLLYENPWNCSNCSMVWMKNQSLISRNNHSLITCAEPKACAGLSLFDERVFSKCSIPIPYSRAGLTIVVVIGCILFVVALATLILYMRRRRRKMVATHRTPLANGVKETISYRQMRDSSPFSIAEDD